MKKTIHQLWLLCLVAGLPAVGRATVILSENFDNIGTLSGSGWTIVNNSTIGGSTSYFQGNTGVFGAQAGAADAYIAANFENASFGGNISTWLILPTLTLDSSTRLTFYTRTEAGSPFPDRLEVRMSTSGASSNVGATDASVGNFSTVLLGVNPSLAFGGYPEAWQQFTVDLTSLGSATSGRLAFRYVVPNTSINANYIGIDTVRVEALNATVPDSGSTLGLLLIGMTGALGVHLRNNNGREGKNHA